MTSLFTAFVARGLEVPEIDPRLLSHVDVREVISDDERPAASADEPAPSDAPVQASPDPAAPSSDEGTTTPA